ncbi:MAG: hypothetical protein KTR13_07290 [Saprospiraceae bacterium]|nr:hypothetical protein [Saprospiraceae bacterium]
MKTYHLIYIILLSFSITSCIGKVKEAQEDLQEASEGFGNLNKAVKELKNASEDIKELSKLEPMTNEEFKAWMPEAIGDMPRTGYKTGQAQYMNVASAEATYKNEDKTKDIKITIIDGAGETGALAISGIRMATAMDMEQEDEYGYQKTVKKEGFKAIEKYKTNGQRLELMFLYNDRYAVTVNSKGMEAKEIWGYIDEMDLTKLKKS